MKKLSSLLFLIVFVLNGFTQSLSVTPDGLKNRDDVSKSFVVINVEGLNSQALYDNALKYINKTYKNPDKVIKGNIKGEYLSFVTHVSDFLVYNNSGAKIPISANYRTELHFKDNKVKFEIIELEMPGPSPSYEVIFSGGAMQGYIIYNKKGVLKKEETKNNIETYFNSYIEDLENDLKGINSESEEW